MYLFIPKKTENLKFIPWQRYVLQLTIDEKKTINLGRISDKRIAARIVNRLKLFAGYRPAIYDTRRKKEVF